MISWTQSSARLRAFVVSLFLLSQVSTAVAAAPLAFPGAEGFGANTSGGRGGTVYHVTNLNDSGVGSFRDAVSVAGRTVVFDVGGIIVLTSPVVPKSNITIAGQTAPGGGITLYGDRIGLSGVTNILIRYLRVREGINGDSGTDTLSADSGDRMMFDHVSASWGRDETFSFNGTASNVTLQDCIIGQGLLVHSAGGLVQTSGGVSIFRCLYIDNWMRNPKVKGVNDYRNNVVYNWGAGGGYIPAGDSAGLSFANLIGNYFIAGPNTGSEGPFKTGNQNYNLYHAGNFQDLNLNGALDGAAVTDGSFPTLHLVATPHNYPAPATALTAAQALSHIIAYAGASLHRDFADTYMINELTSLGTAGAQIFNESEIGGVGTVASGLPPLDTDGDGMPDYWEQAAGTNPLVADNNGDIDGDGYTNLENYLNSLVIAGVPAVTIDGIASDTGSGANDGITSDHSLVLLGTAAAGTTITLSRVDTGVIGTAVADGAGQWTFDYTGTPLADRYYAFTATAALVGGGTSPATRAFVVKIDSTAASAPAITSIVATPSFLINGTSEPGSAISVTLVGTGIVGAATTDELGNWSAPYSGAPLAPGSYTFTAQAIDVAGNTGPASSPYAVDTSLAAPVFTSITTDSGAAGDYLTNDPSLIFNGTSFGNALVTITRVGVGVIGTATANVGGAWSFSYETTTLAAGTHTFTATASSGGSSSPASAPRLVTIDTTRPIVSAIRRQNPLTAATTGSTLVYRVTFAEPVTGVDATDFALTLSGVTATIGTLTPVSSTVYDVTVNGATGDGTVRLDLKASGTGIADTAGNLANVAFTAGQTYTIRLPGSGVWISEDVDQLWSNAANWEAGIIANGSGATADFSSLNIDDVFTVQLDSARTLGRLVFGDADFNTPALWTLSNHGSPANILTLAGATPTIQVNAATTPSGDTVDVPAANAFPSTLDVVLAGTSGFTKTGVGTLVLTRPNTISGPLTITKGIVEIGVGGSLTPTAVGAAATVTIATSQQLRVSGGTFSTAGDITWASGTGTGIIVSAGSASFQKIKPSNTRNSFFRVSGGVVTATELNFPRSGDSEVQALAAGIFITGGDTTLGTVGLGTADSWGSLAVSGGKLTVTDTLNNAFQGTGGRGGIINISGGEFNVTSATTGLIMSRNPITATPAGANNPNNVSKLTIAGGVSNIARLALGYDATSSAGSATVTLSDGVLNLGSGGLVKNGTLSTTVALNGGTLGANAFWFTTVPLTLGGTPATFFVRAANSAGTPFNIEFSGPVSGPGGFTKTGGGTLALWGNNTFTGPVVVQAGVLRIVSNLGAGDPIDVNAGASLIATGTVSRVVNLSGSVVPQGDSTSRKFSGDSLTWQSGGRLAFNLGANGVSTQIALTGALTRGASGPYTIALKAGSGLAAGNVYPLMTFGSTNFVGSDFTITGLPAGYSGVVTLTGTSLQLTIVTQAALFAEKAAASPLSATVTLSNLTQPYSGSPVLPTATTAPSGLKVNLTYDGKVTAPTLPGSYAVLATIADPNYRGTASGTLAVKATALLRNPPLLKGDIDGSIEILTGKNFTLNGPSYVASDVLVPGTPTVQLEGQPAFLGTQDGLGQTTPSDYTITLKGDVLARYVVRRVDPIAMPTIAAPQATENTRDVVATAADDAIGDFTTLRSLALSGDSGMRTIPAGAYGNFAAAGDTGFILGVAGATQPSVYHLQSLTLGGNAKLQIVGPVVLKLANGLSLDTSVGSAAQPDWLKIEISNGGLTLQSNAVFHGEVIAPDGTVVINAHAVLHGRIVADALTVDGEGLLTERAAP